MTQILVTLDEEGATQRVRRAIELLRGVLSTVVFQMHDEADAKTVKQQTYVKETIERAYSQVRTASSSGQQLQSADDFINQLREEQSL